MGLQVAARRIRYAVFVVGLVALVATLFLLAPLVWSVLQIFIIAILITLALDVPVHWQVVRGVPRWAATLNLLILSIITIITIISFLIPPLVTQSREFTATLPSFWTQVTTQFTLLSHRFPQIERSLNLNDVVIRVLTGAGSWGGVARSIFASAFGAVTAVVLILVLVFYTLLNPWPLLYGLRGLFPSSWWESVDHISHEIARRLRAWAIGIIVLAVFIGLLDYLALLLINISFGPNIPFIFLFAIIGGLLEVVPIVGPIIAAVIPGLIGFSIDPFLGLMVLLAFLVVQQLESNLITPFVMHTAVQLHPVSTLCSLVVLSGVFGIFGALISVPTAVVLKVLYDQWYYPLLHAGKHPSPPPRESGVIVKDA